MSEDLQKMFIEDSPQDVDNLVGAENLSDLVIQLQKLEDEVKDDEERLKLRGSGRENMDCIQECVRLTSTVIRPENKDKLVCCFERLGR